MARLARATAAPAGCDCRRRWSRSNRQRVDASQIGRGPRQAPTLSDLRRRRGTQTAFVLTFTLGRRVEQTN